MTFVPTRIYMMKRLDEGTLLGPVVRVGPRKTREVLSRRTGGSTGEPDRRPESSGREGQRTEVDPGGKKGISTKGRTLLCSVSKGYPESRTYVRRGDPSGEGRSLVRVPSPP